MSTPNQIEQYQQIREGGSWRTWPIVRWLRPLGWRRLRPLRDGQSDGLSTIRYYWTDFLLRHRAEVRGRALEIGETSTIRLFGGDAVTAPEALDLAAHSPEVKVVADLSRADDVAPDQYDCFVNQFTTCVIYDIRAALYHALRLVKPGGTLLINFWCVDYYLHRGLDMGTGAPLYMYHWFTPIQVHDLLQRLALTEKDYTLTVYGNLLTRLAFLLNIPARDFTPAELDHQDPGQPLLICVSIRKPNAWHVEPPEYREPVWQPDVAPDVMRADTGHYGDSYRAG